MHSLYVLHSRQHDVRYLLAELAAAHGTQQLHDATDLVVCWTYETIDRSQTGTQWWLNHPTAVQNSRSHAHVREVLRWNGIRCADSEDDVRARAGRSLLVSVCNLRAVAVRSGGKYLRVTAWVRACRLAVRAVHALQLDFADVTIAFAWNGALSVVAVEAVPQLTATSGKLYARAIMAYARTRDSFLRRKANGTLRPIFGTDLEFILVTPQHRISPASLYLPRQGVVGHDALRAPGRKRLYPIVEIRPHPARHPAALLLNIERALQLAARKINRRGLRWLAGAMPLGKFALGGHLHISRYWLCARFLRTLDHYLALPFAMCESANAIKRREKYGRFGDFRRQFHGGFEYRTLPSWLTNPMWAGAVLALFYLLALHFPDLPDLPAGATLTDARLQRAYYSGDKRQLLEAVQTIWHRLQQLPAYSQLSHWLEPFRKQSLAMRPWDEWSDVRAAWKITSER